MKPRRRRTHRVMIEASLRGLDLWPGDWVQFMDPVCGPWCIRVVSFDRHGKLTWA